MMNFYAQHCFNFFYLFLFLWVSETAWGQCPPNVTISATTVCGGESVSFQVEDSIDGATYTWDMGDSNTLVGSSVTYTGYEIVNMDMSYPIELIVEDAMGTIVCSAMVVGIIDVLATPYIDGIEVSPSDFSARCIQAGLPFEPYTVEFVVPVLPGATYTWDFGDDTGIIVGTNQMDHTYNWYGNFNVVLVIENPNGCQATYFTQVCFLRELVNPSFTVQANICTNDIVEMHIDSSPDFVGAYIIDWGDGLTERVEVHHIGVDVVVLEFEDGTMDTVLISDWGNYVFTHIYQPVLSALCTMTTFDTVYVIEVNIESCCVIVDFVISGTQIDIAPQAVIDANTTYCINDLTFSPSGMVCPSDPALILNWEFDGMSISGVTNPVFNVPNTKGVYSIDLNVTNTVNGCGDAMTIENIVFVDDPIADFTYTTSDPNDCISGMMPLLITLTDLSIFCPNDNPDYEWTVSGGGAFFTDNNSTITNIVNPTIEVPMSGIVTVELNVANVCGMDDIEVDITVNQAPTLQLINLDTLCLTASQMPYNYTFDLEPAPATLGLTNANTTWTITNLNTGVGNTYPGITPPPINLNDFAPYEVIVTASGCGQTSTAIDTFAIFQTPDITATANPSSIFTGQTSTIMLGNTPAVPIDTFFICNAGGVEIDTVLPPLSSWTTPILTATTEYMIKGVAANGCTDTESVTIDVGTQPSVTILNIDGATYCGTPQTIDLEAQISNVTGAYDMLWQSIGGIIATPTAELTTIDYSMTGSYDVTVTMTTGGVSYTDVATISICEPPIVGIEPPSDICVGQTITLQSDPVFSGEWFDGNGDPVGTGENVSVSPSVTTTYSFVGTNCGICDTMATTMVTVHQLPVVAIASPVSNITCELGNPIPLTASVNGTTSTTGIWTVNGDPGTDIFDPDGMMEGNYLICYEFTDANLCTDMDCIEIEIEPVPMATINGNVLICVGDTETYTGGVPGQVNNWYVNGGSSMSDMETFDFIPTDAGQYTLTLEVGVAPCWDVATILVDVIAPLVPDFTLDQHEVCLGDEVIVIDHTSLDPSMMDWSVDGMPYSLLADFSPIQITHNDTMRDTIIVKQFVANGCGEDSLEMQFIMLPQPHIDLYLSPLDTICSTDTIQILVEAFGDAANFELTCNYCDYLDPSNANFALADSTQLIFDIGNIDTIVIDQIIVQSSNVCATTADTVYVAILPNQPIAAIFAEGAAPDLTICAGETVTYFDHSVGGAMGNEWITENGSTFDQNSITIAYDTPGEYCVKLKAFGCGLDSTELKINVLAAPTAVIIDEGVICEGTTAILSTVLNGIDPVEAQITWLVNGIVAGHDLTLAWQFNQAGTDTVCLKVAANSYLCDFVQIYEQIVLPAYQIEMPETMTIVNGEGQFMEVTIPQLSDNATILWSPSEGLSDPTVSNPFVNPDFSTTYILTVDDGTHCRAIDSISVIVETEIVEFLVPTAFSPNNDGVNDLMRFHHKYLKQLNYFVIQNRWSERVFYTDKFGEQYSEAWDGVFREKDSPIGVYAYHIEYVDNDGEIKHKSGNFTLIR